LQDGSNDLNIYGGDWWMANQMMERALTFAGYEVNHVWGDGGHNGKHATEVFADAMRWLWKDWPAPIKAGQTKNAMLNDILIPGEDWQRVDKYPFFDYVEHCAVNANGEVFFSGSRKIYRMSLDDQVTVFRDNIGYPHGLAFGPDGQLYIVAPHTNQVIACTADGRMTVVADNFKGESIVVRHDGSIYSTEGDPKADWVSFVSSISPAAKRWAKMRYAKGITLSPDQSLLYVNDYHSHWVESFQIQPDGSLENRQHYYYLHVTDYNLSCADGMCVDSYGRLYVATALGVQVCDQAGRVNVIIPTPEKRCRHLCIGGENFDTLFVFCGYKIFKRKLKVKGVLPFQPPVKPAKPRL
jgi:sugar lactone lactonase YvrE